MDEDLAALVRADVRKYLAELARRYGSITAVVVALALIAVLIPARSDSKNEALNATSGVDAGSGSSGQLGATGSSDGSSSSGDVVGATTGGGSSSGGGAGDVAAGAGTGGTVPGATGTAKSGVARSGVTCGPGVKQVPWTVYSGPCVPAWSGDNGGATAHGVTGDEITFVYRKMTECDWAFDCDGGINDTRVWIDLLNKNFELYGRKVVLEVFDGQGSLVLELDGKGQAQAQADAQTAYDLGAFAEAASFDVPVWGDALADKGIIYPGLASPSEKNLDERTPYAHGTPFWLTADNLARAVLATACDRMKGMPAIFAGDPIYQNTERVFGLVNVDQPDWSESGRRILAEGKARCGLEMASQATYSPDVNSMAQQATPIIAQLKAAGVTTVVAVTDSLMFTLLQTSASQQNYYPEWITSDLYAVTRLAPVDQLRHTIKLAQIATYLGLDEQEAWKAYQLERPGEEPHEQAWSGTGAVTGGADGTFYNLLLQFNAIQAAGPNLTPQTFNQGWRSQPSAEGPYGLFRYSEPGYQDPASDFLVAWFDPEMTAKVDGKQGDWRACNEGKRYVLPNIENMGSGQLNCFGQ